MAQVAAQDDDADVGYDEGDADVGYDERDDGLRRTMTKRGAVQISSVEELIEITTDERNDLRGKPVRFRSEKPQ